ncbi:MAG: TolC family protein [Leptospirillia bacterium]
MIRPTIVINALVASLLLLPSAYAETSLSQPLPDDVTAVTPSGQTLSLQDAVGEALLRRPTLKAATDSVLLSKAQIGAARSGYLPTLQASYSDTVGNSIFGFFLIPGYQYANYDLLTVALTQTVYDFGRVHSQMRQSRHQLEAAKAQSRREAQRVIRDVETAYYALLKAQHRVLSARQSVVDASSHLSQARARLSAGVGLRLDVTQAKVNIESARLDLIHEETLRRKAQVDLGRAIGFRKKRPFVAVSSGETPTIPSLRDGSDLDRLLENHPELQVDAENVRQKKAALDAVKDQNYPSIVGSAQYYLAQISVPLFGLPTQPYSTVNVGGVLNIPILSGGLTTSQIHEARADMHRTMHQAEDDRLRILASVRDAALDVQEADERLRETKTALENARENDRQVEASYRAGTAHSVDVVDAETALRRARVEVDSARFDLMSAIVSYRYSLGTLRPPAAP